MRVLGIVLVLLLLFAASARPQEAVEIEKCYGNRLVYGEVLEPNSFNPLAKALNLSGRRLRELMFESLYCINKKGQYEPQLARDFTLSIGDSLLRVSLRLGAVWHDGRPVTAEDVVFTYNCVLDRGSSVSEDQRACKALIRRAWAPDNYTVVFELRQLPGSPEALLCARIVPKHLFGGCSVEQIDSTLDLLARKPVGSGPFAFDQRNAIFGTVNLKANRSHYKRPAFDRDLTRFGTRSGPFLDEIEMRPYPSTINEVADLSSGSIHLIPFVYPEQISELRRFDYITLAPYMSLSVRQMDCNFRCLPLRDVRLRQAISKAIDRDALIRQHLAGQASPASGPYPAGHSFVPHDAAPLGFDPDEARRLLGEMGYQAASQGYATTATGQHIRLRLMVLPTAVGDRAVQVCEGIKGYLEDVGIEVTLASVTRAQFYEALESGQGYDLLYTQSVVPMNSSLMGRYAGESDLPSGVLSAVRVLIGNRESTGDLDAVRMAENEFHRQMAGLSPSIYLWDPNGVAAFTMDLHNVDIHPFYFFSYVLNWYRQRFE